MRIIDLTHPISAALPVYFPWHPATAYEQTATYEENLCVVHRLTIGTHSGTHIDAPSHVFRGMFTVDQYDPGLWYSDAQVLDFTPRKPATEITEEEFRERGVRERTGVVVKTGWDIHFGKKDYYRTYPPISNKAAEYLAELHVPLLAADTPFKLDVHYTMLRRGIPLITNLNNTALLRPGMVKLITAPLLIKDGDGAPTRVLAVLEEPESSR
jgi:kynurenine formamidase